MGSAADFRAIRLGRGEAGHCRKSQQTEEKWRSGRNRSDETEHPHKRQGKEG